MLVYLHQEAVKWRADRFICLRGLIDELLHKTDFHLENNPKMLDGAYFVKVQRELFAYEAAQTALLREQLAPKIIALRLLDAPKDTEQIDIPRSTGAVRAAHAAIEQRARVEKERKKLIEEVRVELERTDARIRQAYGSANIALARYSKAAKFCVMHEEIPYFEPGFSPKTEAMTLGIEQEVYLE